MGGVDFTGIYMLCSFNIRDFMECGGIPVDRPILEGNQRFVVPVL